MEYKHKYTSSTVRIMTLRQKAFEEHLARAFNVNKEKGLTRIFQVEYYRDGELEATDYYLPHMFSAFGIFDEDLEIRFKTIYVPLDDERYTNWDDNCEVGLCFNLPLKQ